MSGRAGNTALRACLGVALAVLAAAYVARVAGHFPALALEPVREPRLRIQAPLARFLDSLDRPLELTYFVTARARMPSSMRDVEPAVTALLARIAARRPELVRVEVLDPTDREDVVRLAARRGAAPFRRRDIRHDSVSETRVWSTLTLRWRGQDAALHAIQPQHLPHLQRLLLEHLRRIEAPRPPLLALAAPPGYRQLEAQLRELGDVVRVDLDGGDALPTGADCLFWMEPRSGAERARELDAYLDAGHAVVLAPPGASVQVTGAGSEDAQVTLTGPTTGPNALLAQLGIDQGPELVLDATHAKWPGEPSIEAPFLVRCIAPEQDFRGFPDQPNGDLLFLAPHAIAADPEVLAPQGLTADVLASSSDRTWLQRWPDAPLAVADLRPTEDRAAAKQALILALQRPGDPWRAPLVALAAPTPLQDPWLDMEGNAHRRLLRTLVQGLASPQRQVIARAAVDRGQPLPALSAGERWRWRGVCVFLTPALLLGVWWLRRRREPRSRVQWRPLMAGSAVLAGAVLLGSAAARLPWQWDVTADHRNRMAPGTEHLAARLAGQAPIAAEWFVSDAARLPPPLRPLAPAVPRLLERLTAAGAPLSLRVVDPAALTEPERAALRGEGVIARSQTRDEDGAAVTRDYDATLRLTRGERRELVALPDARAFEDLEFRVAFALSRLTTGHTPHVAFASDSPRPSAAEAYEQYQSQGLMPPRGHDVYARARQALVDAGFRVTHVNPRAPRMPADADVLVWLQPRRSIEPMLTEVIRFLRRGGRVFLAAQQFHLQAHQYRGAGYGLVYWPEPQFPDVDQLYFPDLGIELMREVLFDRLHDELVQDVRIHGRETARVFEPQRTALPAWIRGAAVNTRGDTPVTAGLGDQAFAGAARLRLDRERLRERGLSATVLWTTSPWTWSDAWQAGWIPDAFLAGPAPELEGGSDWLGEVPLLVQVDGRFPLPEGALPVPGSATRDPPPDPFADLRGATGEDGRLLFLGCSGVFQDDRLLEEGRRGDQLLLNVVASLALPDDLARVAGHRSVEPGLGYVTPAARTGWRVLVLGAAPLAIGVFGGLWRLLRRASPRSLA